jgi:hypothetical protein
MRYSESRESPNPPTDAVRDMNATAHQPDDGQLVTCALGGETEAFALLFDRYARLGRAVVWDAGFD